MTAATKSDGSANVIAAARHIVRTLATTTPNAANDMMHILSAFDQRLSSFPDIFTAAPDGGDAGSVSAAGDGGFPGGGADDAGPSEAEIRLGEAERVILHWDPSNPDSLIWDSPDAAARYLCAVDGVVAIAEEAGDDADLRGRAESVLHVAATRLEDEFQNLMIRNSAALDPAGLLCSSVQRLSLSKQRSDGWHEDGQEQGSVDREERTAISLQDSNLIRPEVVTDLKMIADRVISIGYRHELCHVYSRVRRDALMEYLEVFGLNPLGMEEVQHLKWEILDDKMRKWIQGLKTIVRDILPGEQKLCNQIFLSATEEFKGGCFNESSKLCIMQLLNFAEAIAIGKWSSEKLFRILDMHEALSEVLPQIQILFTGYPKDFISGEAKGILKRLGDAAKGALSDFGDALGGEVSKDVPPAGDLHPVSRYVMNYMGYLVDYRGLLNQLLLHDGDFINQDSNEDGAECISPLGSRLLLLLSLLETSLEEKSKSYKDLGIKYVFLMNNMIYIVHKVKDSELMTLLGEHWVRKHKGRIRQYGTSYLRESWSKVLICVRDEGLGGSGSSHGVSKTVLREKFKSFNLAFEEIYSTQIAWKIPDPKVREELRISISEYVFPAYRAFVSRYGSYLEGTRYAAKYMKYMPEDLEKYLGDFFEGMTHQSNHLKRKLSLP